MALWALLITSRQRWVRSNILRHTSGLALLVVEHVAEDAGGDGVFGVLASAAGELELVGVGVFFWVEHVGAQNLLEKGVDYEEMRLTYHSEQKRKVICSRGFFCSSLSADGEDMMRFVVRRRGLSVM